MAQNELSHPIQVTLDGTNYTIWAQSMRIFLECRKLWLYVTGDLKKPTKGPTESDEAFCTRLIDWDSNHHQILMWFRNTTIPSISMMFGRFDDSKSAWDMLASRYSSADGSGEYQLMLELYHLKQESGQTINDLFARMQFLWDQLSLLDPAWKDPEDAQLYATRRDQHRLYQFLMALRDDFESVRGQLLHHTPLPSLDKAVFELVREETRLQTLHSQHSHTILAASSFNCSSSQLECSKKSSPHRPPFKTHNNNHCHYCRHPGHTIENCRHRPKSNAPTTSVANTKSAPSLAATFGESPGLTFTLSIADLEAIVNQVLSRSDNASSSVHSIWPGSLDKADTWD